MITRKELVRCADEVYMLPRYEGAKKRFNGYLDRIRKYLSEQRYPNETEYHSELESLTKRVEEIGTNIFDEQGDDRRHQKIQRGIRNLIHQIFAQHPRIFVVHGRNINLRNAITSTIGRLKLDYEVLQDRSNSGATVVEKFIACAEECDCAVVLMTADDEGGVRGSGAHALRARQNVILELGYFIRHVGRKRIIMIQEADVHIEWPSDLNGIVRIPFDEGGGWKGSMLKEFESAGVYLHPPYVRNV